MGFFKSRGKEAGARHHARMAGMTLQSPTR
jgi:hypothetical protein